MIVNADDFGYEPRVNLAIVRAFEEGLISSTTVMANMPGFEEACRLAHRHALHAHVGVHLVLTEGAPLTERIRRSRRFCDESGRFFHWSLTGRALRLGAPERMAVAEELRAQVVRCRRAGLPVTHLDSHHQVHSQPAIGHVVVAVARELGVPFVRLAENCRPGMTVRHRAVTSYLNARLRLAGLARTRYAGTVADFVHACSGPARLRPLSDFEVMTHPVINGDGVLGDRLVDGETLAELVSRVPGYRGAVSFVGASYRGGA